MRTCRLSVNDAVVEEWVSKFAAGQVCMQTMFGCNNIEHNSNRKNFHRCVCWCEIYLPNTHIRTQVFVQKKVLRQSLPPKLHGRFAVIMNDNVQCHLLLLDEKKTQCRAHFRRHKYDCKIRCHVWHAGNRVGGNYTGTIYPHSVCCLFRHVKARLHVNFWTLTPTTSQFWCMLLCAQKICRNGLCVRASTVLGGQGDILVVKLPYCSGDSV